ncbi:hypothetical protein Tco_0292132 [Tanacetum coccineum]
MSKRQPGTRGSNEGTGNILGVPDESTVVSRASSEGTGSKPGVPDEEKLILEWEADVDSEHFDRDDNAGDDNEETGVGDDNYYNLPPRTVSPDPVAIVASRAVDPVGSPSSTTIDQDGNHSTSLHHNKSVNSHLKSLSGPVPQFMAPDHSSSGPVLHEMTSDQIRSDLTPNRQGVCDNIPQPTLLESSSVANIDNENIDSFQPTESLNTHMDPNVVIPLEQVLTFLQILCANKDNACIDPEMCMFTLTGLSTEEPTNSRRLMADSA